MLALLVALGTLGTPPEAALVDDRWAESRSHLGAVMLLKTQPIPSGVPARPLRPDGPIYRLPVSGCPIGKDGDMLIATHPGDVALAPASGRVAYAGRYRRYGGVLILDHGHGWTTVLTGLAAIDVPQGVGLVGGDPIGRAGAHIRIRLLHHGQSVDVAKMLARLG